MSDCTSTIDDVLLQHVGLPHPVWRNGESGLLGYLVWLSLTPTVIQGFQKMRYWATPNCATLGHSDLLWPTLTYSGLLWTTSIGLWTLDWGWLRVTNWTTHYHKDSLKTFSWLIGLLDSFMSSLLLLRLLKLSFITWWTTPCSHSCCPPGMTWDTFLTLRGTKGIYLDHVSTLTKTL